MLETLMNFGFTPEASNVWSWRDRPEMLMTYLNHGGDARIRLADVPLLFVAPTLEVTQKIIECGEDPKVLDDGGKNVFFYVQTPEQVVWLKEKGIDLTCKTSDGVTLAEFSVEARSDETAIVSEILRQIPDANMVCSDEEPILFHSWRDVSFLSVLMERGVDLKQTDSQGRTLLHYAVSPEIGDFLLKNGLDVNAKDAEGGTPLHYAHDWDLKTCLLEKGADFMAENNNGETPLEYQLRDAHSLIESIQELVNMQDSSSVTNEILQEKITELNNYTQIIDSFIDLNCDVTTIFKKMIANHLNVVPLFCSSKIDLSVLGEGGETFLQSLVTKMQEEVETMLSANEEQQKAAETELQKNQLIELSIQKRTEIENYYVITIVKLVKGGAKIDQKNAEGSALIHISVQTYLPIITAAAIELGADLNIQDANGNTPLHYAATNKLQQLGIQETSFGTKSYSVTKVSDIETVRLLLEHGANVNIANTLGQTPLFGTVTANHREIVELLLESGAEDLKDATGSSALHFAATIEMADLLVEHGFDLHLKDKNGLNVLKGAVLANNWEMIDALLERGVEFPKDSEGDSLAFYATTPEMLQFLMEKGVKMERAINEKGESPLHTLCKLAAVMVWLGRDEDKAKVEGYLAMAKMLLDAGCDPNLEDNEGMTPTRYAEICEPLATLFGVPLVDSLGYETEDENE